MANTVGAGGPTVTVFAGGTENPVVTRFAKLEVSALPVCCWRPASSLKSLVSEHFGRPRKLESEGSSSDRDLLRKKVHFPWPSFYWDHPLDGATLFESGFFSLC